MKLREYQKEAIETVANQYKNEISRQLIVLPTGTGKTVLMAAIAKRFRQNTLIIAHREELIQQAKKTILRYWPKADIGICKSTKNELEHKIVIGSIQTCCQPKRLRQLKKKGFSLLIVDEAHHAPAASYQRVIKKLGFMDDSKKLLVGLTATPERNDKLSISSVFQEIVFRRSISEMIDGGFLSPVVGRKIRTDVSLKGVKSYNGDFIAKDLAAAINIPERNSLIANKYKQHASNRKGIAFCVNVQHCHDLAQAFRDEGISAKAVWGEMPAEDRKSALQELRNNQTQVLTSCGILTEGYDESSIECIVMARSTKSKSLFIQCLGRGLRTYPQKKYCLVLDFTDSQHNLKTIASLDSTGLGATITDENRSANTGIEKQREVALVNTKITEVSDQEFDLLGRGKFVWVTLEQGEFSLEDDNKNEFIIRPSANGFIVELHQKYSDPILATPVLTQKQCVEFCENFADQYLSMKFGDIDGPWFQSSLKQPATPGQQKILKQYGLFKQGMSKAHAAMEMRKNMAKKRQHGRFYNGHDPITEKQKKFLERANISVENLGKLEAIKLISQIIREDKLERPHYGTR